MFISFNAFELNHIKTRNYVIVIDANLIENPNSANFQSLFHLVKYVIADQISQVVWEVIEKTFCDVV